MSRHVLGLCPSSGATSSTLRPSKISRLAKLPRRSRGIVSSGSPTAIAAGWKMGPRQVFQTARDRGRREDALAPVVPVVARPLAKDELIVARAAAADAELGEVAGERRE